MIFKIFASVAIIGWIVGNIWWHVVREPYLPRMTVQEWFSGLLVALSTVSGIAAIVALILGV